MFLNALRHYCLVSEMIGVEGIVTAELALMVVNLQSLGVSVALTSIPIIASALTSLVLIPLLGFITVRCAKTARQKALSLIAVNAWQILGVALIIIANIMKLQRDQEIMNNKSNNTTISRPDKANLDAVLDPAYSFQTPSENSSSPYFVFTNLSTSSRHLEDITEGGHRHPAGIEGLHLHAILAIIGYSMTDSGYDTGSCFLKTFALSCTPQRDHTDIIVRAIQMSSLGGVIATLLGSVGVGEELAKGTDLEVNSVTTIVIMAITVLILLPTAVFSLTTGLCCMDGLYAQEWTGPLDSEESTVDRSKYEATYDEKQSLISDSFASTSSVGDKWQVSFSSVRNNDDMGYHTSDNFGRLRPTSSRGQGRQSSVSKDLMDRIFQLSQSGAHSLMEEELNNVNMKSGGMEQGRGFVELTGDKGYFGKMRHILKQQEKRLVLCIGSFFALGALFAFNMYSVNFVTASICDGDPTSSPGSEKYKNYLRGVKIGSTGLLVFYASFVVGTTVQDILLRKVGWWVETSIMFTLYIIVSITCAITKLEWVYYICAFTNGLHRAVMFTVPYIMACRLLTENKDDTDSPEQGKTKSQHNGDIALVAAMLPLSLVMCAMVIGPMIQLTGDAATPLYFSGVSAAFGFLLFSLLRKY